MVSVPKCRGDRFLPPAERFAALPPHMRTRRWILAALAHEEYQGTCTFYACLCGRGYRRACYCPVCWREMLAVLEGKEKSARVTDNQERLWSQTKQKMPS